MEREVWAGDGLMSQWGGDFAAMLEPSHGSATNGRVEWEDS